MAGPLMQRRPQVTLNALLILSVIMAGTILYLLATRAGIYGSTSAMSSEQLALKGELQISKETIKLLHEQARQLWQMRKDYGKMYCNAKGIGPRGGFCIPKNASVGTNTLANDHLDQPLCNEMAAILKGKTVLDLGCGVGNYGRCLTKQDPYIRWTGIDGAEGIEDVTSGYVNFADLSVPIVLEDKFDVVVSLEVGEHIPAEYETTLFLNIVRHAKQGVLLSWALPGQPGHHHVNNKPNEYVIKRMEEFGFDYDKVTSDKLRSAASFDWFKKTTMMFWRKAAETPAGL